jgi:hypothetical protein
VGFFIDWLLTRLGTKLPPASLAVPRYACILMSRLTAKKIRRRKTNRQDGARVCLLQILALTAFLGLGWLAFTVYIFYFTAWPMSRSKEHFALGNPPSLRKPLTSDPNPYFGWQPITSDRMGCSWRECFKENHQCTTCRDLIEEWGTVPSVDDGWIPDVTLLHRMRLVGKDSRGQPWPPVLSDELCEKIGPFGGHSNDPNKDCMFISRVDISETSVQYLLIFCPYL